MTEPQQTSPDRLDSWKAIADYLQRDVRTVRRWEQKLGLLVGSSAVRASTVGLERGLLEQQLLIALLDVREHRVELIDQLAQLVIVTGAPTRAPLRTVQTELARRRRSAIG